MDVQAQGYLWLQLKAMSGDLRNVPPKSPFYIFSPIIVKDGKSLRLDHVGLKIEG